MTAGAFQIRARHLWDGAAAMADGPAAVTLAGGRVAAVHVGEPPAPPAPGGVLDCGDATVLPGLIDMHTHLGIDHRSGDIRAQMRDPALRHILAGARSLRDDLAAGVTTTKLNGDRDFYDVQMRQAVRDGVAEGPQLFVSGKGIKAPGCTGGVVATCVADGVEAVERGVEDNLAANVDWIKLFASGSVFGPLADVLRPSYGPAELSAAARKAHAAERRISVHCFGGEAADACLAAGVDVIDHGWLLTETQLEAMALRGIWLCPTLGVLAHPEGLLPHLPTGPARKEGRERVEQVGRVVQTALRLGVPLLVGTDARHGCLAYELGLLQELGGRPEALLAAVTGQAARALGQEGEIGTLRQGARADVLVVRGNALRDVARLADVLMVVQSGRIVVRPPGGDGVR